MPDLTPERIGTIIAALIAAVSTLLAGFSQTESASLRDILQDERHACAGTLEQIAEQYSDTLSTLRDICRE